MSHHNHGRREHNGIMVKWKWNNSLTKQLAKLWQNKSETIHWQDDWKNYGKISETIKFIEINFIEKTNNSKSEAIDWQNI